jgi:hypothetical protein
MTGASGPYDFVYVHTDIPEGMTIRDWRAQRAAAGRPLRGERPRVARTVCGLRAMLPRVRVDEVPHSSGAHGSIRS